MEGRREPEGRVPNFILKLSVACNMHATGRRIAPDANYLIVPERGRAVRVNQGNRSEKDEYDANGNHRSRENCV